MGRVGRRLAMVAVLVGTTLLIGTLGFRIVEGYSYFDGFYMSLITITTVGYAEVRELSRQGRIFNSFVILFGSVSMFVALGAMTQTIIELQFGEFFEKRRTKRMIQHLKDHYIVCGYGRVGRGAAEELQRAQVPLVVVDPDEDRIERAIRAGMLAVAADPTLDESLHELGIDRARGLIAALATDADNLFLVVTVKTMNPKLRVSARVNEETAEPKLRRAGADVVYAPYNITGTRLAHALLRPHVFQFLDFTTKAGLDVGIEQVQVSPHSIFASKTVKDIHLRKELKVTLLAIRRPDGRMLFDPPKDTPIEGGDHLIVMGQPDNLRRLEQMLT